MCRNQIYPLFFLLSLMVSCSKSSKVIEQENFWDDCNVVASKKVVNGDTVIVCDVKKITQHKVVPASVFLDTVSYILLKNDNPEALISKRMAAVYQTDNYMGFSGASYFPFKLFKKDGSFVTNIGAIGQGPGEYPNIDNAFMDEENNRIYVLPYATEKIFVYNFQGEYLLDIKLIKRTMYGSAISVDTKKEQVLVTNSIVANPIYFVWIQDFQGNFKQGIKVSDYFDNLSESFDESTLTNMRTNHIELFRAGYKNTHEYLYHYDIENNRLIPQFRLTNADENISVLIHELPLHYLIERTTSTNPVQDEYVTPKILVDKKTLKGCFVDGYEILDGLVYNDFCIFSMMRGKDFGIFDLSGVVESRLARSKQETDYISTFKKQMAALKESPEDECSVVFVGKFKQAKE